MHTEAPNDGVQHSASSGCRCDPGLSAFRVAHACSFPRTLPAVTLSADCRWWHVVLDAVVRAAHSRTLAHRQLASTTPAECCAVERAHVPIGGSESFWSITIEHLVRRRPVVTGTGVERDTGGRLLRGRGRGRHGTAGLGVAIVRIGEQRVTLCGFTKPK